VNSMMNVSIDAGSLAAMARNMVFNEIVRIDPDLTPGEIYEMLNTTPWKAKMSAAEAELANRFSKTTNKETEMTSTTTQIAHSLANLHRNAAPAVVEAAAEKKGFPKPKISSDAPPKLIAVLEAHALMREALGFTAEEDTKMRERIARTFVTARAETDRRYATLLVWADGCDEPAFKIFADCRPESLREAAIRVLKKIKAKFPDKLGDAVDEFDNAGVVRLL